MKSTLRFGLCALMLICAVASHGNASAASVASVASVAFTSAKGELRILATTFPVWLMTRNIVHNVPGVKVDLMIPAQAGCPHDYALSPEDVRKLEWADVLVLNGLGLEAFLDGHPAVEALPLQAVLDAEGQSTAPGLKLEQHAPHGKPGHPVVLVASRGVGPLLFEEDTASPAKSANPEGHEDQGGHSSHNHGAINPHFFASPRMTAQMARNIGEDMAAYDPANAEQYEKNAKTFSAELWALAQDFSALGERVQKPALVVQHEVFDYLARDAGLSILAVVRGDESREPSAAEVMALVREIRTKPGVGGIFTEPQYPDGISRIVAEETGLPVGLLDPVASGPADAPIDYYQRTMLKNLKTLESMLELR